MAADIEQIERLNTPPALAAGRSRAAVLACGLLIAVAVVVNQSAVHWRENVVDSHLFAWHGWCISQGARPYVDIWDNKPPGIWWLNAAGFWIFGPGMNGELLICAVALTAALAAFTAIASAVYDRSILVIATLAGCILLPHPMYEGGANRTETFVLACESLAILAYLCWARRRQWRWLVAAGLAAGAAPLFKQSGLAAGAAIGLHLAGTTLTVRYGRSGYLEDRAARATAPRRGGSSSPQQGRLSAFAIFAASYGIVPGIAIVALAAQGALADAWYAVGPFNRAYFEIGDATYLHVVGALRVFGDALLPLVWMFAGAVIGLLWGVVRHWTRRRRPNVGIAAPAIVAGAPPPTCQLLVREPLVRHPRTYVELFWLWFVLAVYLACVGPGRRGHHFMPALAPLGLLALYPVHLLVSGAGLGRRITARPSAAAITVGYLYGVSLLGWGTAVETGRCWQNKSHWYSLGYAAEPGWQQQAVEIWRCTRPDEAIYVWGWSPGTYRYAYRRAPSRFATFEKVGQLRGRAQFIVDTARQDLRRNPPRVFVISATDLAGVRKDQTNGFGAWLMSEYVDHGVIGGMHIMVAHRPGD